MIYEYAIDPELIIKWSLTSRDYCEFINAFGLGTTRIPSVVQDFHKWQSSIVKKLYELHLQDKEEGKRIENFLKVIGETHIKRPGAQHNGNWYEKVIKEHDRVSFDYIFVADKLKCDTNRTIIQDDIYNDLPEKENKIWKKSTTGIVNRTAKDMSNLTQNLLRLSSHIIFIDPYLHIPKTTIGNKKENRLEPIKEFISKSLENQIIDQEINYEIIYSKNKIEGPKNNDNKSSLQPFSPKSIYKDLFEYLEDKLGKNQLKLIKIVVKNFSEKEYVNNVPVSEQFHNRYILTEYGGVGFGIGLEQSKDCQTDDWYLFSTKQYKDRWKKYVMHPNNYFKISDNDIYPHKNKNQLITGEI